MVRYGDRALLDALPVDSDRLTSSQNQTVVGHWIVDFDEPECISSWGQFDDKVRSEFPYALPRTDEHSQGCTTEASGFRVSDLLRPFPQTYRTFCSTIAFFLWRFSLAFRRSWSIHSADIRGYPLRPPRRWRLARHVPAHTRDRTRHQVHGRNALLSRGQSAAYRLLHALAHNAKQEGKRIYGAWDLEDETCA